MVKCGWCGEILVLVWCNAGGGEVKFSIQRGPVGKVETLNTGIPMIPIRAIYVTKHEQLLHLRLVETSEITFVLYQVFNVYPIS